MDCKPVVVGADVVVDDNCDVDVLIGVVVVTGIGVVVAAVDVVVVEAAWPVVVGC